MNGISTHILDISLGRPAAGVQVTLERGDENTWCKISTRTTDDDGRIREMLPPDMGLVGGVYRLTFDTQAYFDMWNVQGLYPAIQITFRVADTARHFHIPLLLTANGYSTYRGS